jgi:transglutaminase-like putative cysteine protease
MRIRVRHATSYSYDAPAAGVIQALRVTPRDHEGQKVLNWRVDVDVDGFLRESFDAFGNVLQVFYAEGAVNQLTVRVTGEVEVEKTSGVLRGAPEPFPPDVFLRTTPLTEADAALADWTANLPPAAPLPRLHRLMAELNERMSFDTQATGVETRAVDAFGKGHGVCQDYTHIFITAARRMGLPARYVSGHLCRDEGGEQEAAHAWAEAYVPDIGWTGFDPLNCVCPDESYLRIATGLDYLDAAPVRGARRGGGEEHLTVTVLARQSVRQRQD